MSDVFRHRASSCPKCARKLDASSSVAFNAAPNPGDSSVCGYCSTPLMFDDQLALRELADAEFAALPRELRRELGRAIEITKRIREARAARGDS